MKAGDTVLVDTNVIKEGHEKRCWSALTHNFQVETVEQCVIEAMTGKHDWNGLRPDDQTLRSTFHAIHSVSELELAEVKLKGGNGLDDGEQALWAHALARKDTWILCGPDRASMRFGYESGERERLVSLGGLLQTIKYRPTSPLKAHFEQGWLDGLIQKLVLNML